MTADIIDFPIKSGRHETPKAVEFDSLSAPPAEGPLKLHFTLEGALQKSLPASLTLTPQSSPSRKGCHPDKDPLADIGGYGNNRAQDCGW